MIVTQSQPPKYSERVVVELKGRYAPLRKALDMIIEHRRKRAPMFPPDQSEVLRSLIAEEYKRITCLQCGSFTILHPDPAMAAGGVQYCPQCQESVAYQPNDRNGKRP